VLLTFGWITFFHTNHPIVAKNTYRIIINKRPITGYQLILISPPVPLIAYIAYQPNNIIQLKE
jgi:hypothetical protein